MHHKPDTIMHSAQLPLRFDVSTRDVSLIGQYWGQTAIDWPVIRRERPGGSIGADTVNTERCRVDRSLTNGHQPSGTSAIDPAAPCNPLLPGWSVSKGLWCVVVLIPVLETSLQSEQERFLAPRVERATRKSKKGYTETSIFGPPVYILHFVSHHADTLAPFVWNLQRLKEIKHFPWNMLQQLLWYLRPNGTRRGRDASSQNSSRSRLDQETGNNWRDLWKSVPVINIITCLRHVLQ